MQDNLHNIFPGGAATERRYRVFERLALGDGPTVRRRVIVALAGPSGGLNQEAHP